ncbi:MAG: hypothetical protein ACI9HK_005153 [Pirellulaceae bacterium]|jgi:hypothetical protein
MSNDPLSFEGGDANLYRYVKNVATVFTDPSGMETIGQRPALPAGMPLWVQLAYNQECTSNCILGFADCRRTQLTNCEDLWQLCLDYCKGSQQFRVETEDPSGSRLLASIAAAVGGFTIGEIASQTESTSRVARTFKWGGRLVGAIGTILTISDGMDTIASQRLRAYRTSVEKAWRELVRTKYDFKAWQDTKSPTGSCRGRLGAGVFVPGFVNESLDTRDRRLEGFWIRPAGFDNQLIIFFKGADGIWTSTTIDPGRIELGDIEFTPDEIFRIQMRLARLSAEA